MAELVAPIIPDAQKNKAPELLLEGLRTGLSFMSQMSQQRRQTESDIARMALQERLANESHALEQQKLSMAADMIPYQQKMMDAQADFYSERAKAYADGVGSEAQRKIKFNQQMETLMEDFNTQADKRKLNDPMFAAKDPVRFAMNMLNQQDEFRMGNWIPQIRNGLTEYRRIADQQKVKYGTDDKTPTRTIWQIVENLNSGDEEVRKKTIQDLRDAGHFKTRTVPGPKTVDSSRPFTTMWDAIIGPKDIEEDVPNPLIENIQKQAPTFQRVPSRVPPAMLPRTYSTGTEPTAMPDPDLPAVDPDAYPPQSSASPKFDPTETDTLLQNAQAAIRKGAPMKAVAERLHSMGIDPNQLWAT